jgi:hypothetical protein
MSKPTPCPICYSTNLREEIRDCIDWRPCEIEYICKRCSSYVDYFAYGNWDSDQPRGRMVFCWSNVKTLIADMLWIACYRDVFEWAKRTWRIK